MTSSATATKMTLGVIQTVFATTSTACVLCCCDTPCMLQLGLPLLCDDARLGHKGIMHRHVRQLDKPSKVCYLSVEVGLIQGDWQLHRQLSYSQQHLLGTPGCVDMACRHHCSSSCSLTKSVRIMCAVLSCEGTVSFALCLLLCSRGRLRRLTPALLCPTVTPAALWRTCWWRSGGGSC